MSKIRLFRSDSTPTGRFIAMFTGGAIGAYLGFSVLSDYEIIKKLPPRPEQLNEDGTLKPTPFKVTFIPTQPLELKPEAKAKLERELNQKNNAGSESLIE